MNAHISSVQISIHALREEGDLYADAARILQQAISIHALREEGDLSAGIGCAPVAVFLSTPSVRRATRGGVRRLHGRAISIHALREEGDYSFSSAGGFGQGFLSTPSVRRATCCICMAKSCCIFLSTPSVRRATPRLRLNEVRTADFYPRPP